MHASRLRARRRVQFLPQASIQPLEPRTLFAVSTVPIPIDPAFGTTPATDVVVNAVGDVYATRTGGDGSINTQLVVLPNGSVTPQVLASFGPMTEYANTAETPFGQMVVTAAGDVFGVTHFTAVAGVDVPFGQDYTEGTLWELPAHFNTVDVLARFYKPAATPHSLTVDGSGNLYGVVDSLTGAGSRLFVYPVNQTGIYTVPLVVGQTAAAIVVDPGGNVFGTLNAAGDPTGAFRLFEMPQGTTAIKILADVPAALGHDVIGMTLDPAGNLFVTTRQGTNGGALLELPAGGRSAHVVPGSAGLSFNGKPTVDAAGDVFATAANADGTTTIVKFPANGIALQSVATIPGTTADVSADALAVLHGTYTDPATGQATIYAATQQAVTPTPTPSPTPTSTTVGLAPMVTRLAGSTTAVAGAPATRRVTLSLTNTSTAIEAGTATVTVYATPAGTTTGTPIATVGRKVKLAPGSGTAWSTTVRTASLPAGTYSLLAVATDQAGTTIAAGTGPTLTVVPANVSLTATVSATPTAVAAGGFVTFTVAITNRGTVSSTGALVATFALSLDGVAPTVPLGAVRRAVAVKPNAKPVMLRLRVRLPAGTPADSYRPFVSIARVAMEPITAAGVTPVLVG